MAILMSLDSCPSVAQKERCPQIGFPSIRADKRIGDPHQVIVDGWQTLKQKRSSKTNPPLNNFLTIIT